jgi:hypothetical protein
VRVGRDTGATGILLVTSRADEDGVLHGSKTVRGERPHVEDIDALHLSENFETLHTGGLLEIRGDGTGRGTGSDEVIDGLDVCFPFMSDRGSLPLGVSLRDAPFYLEWSPICRGARWKGFFIPERD